MMSSFLLDDTFEINPPNKADLPVVELANHEASTSDSKLVEAVLAGDERAFEKIFERYRRLVARSVGRFFRDRSDVEEFVQQTFTKVFLSLGKFKGAEDDSLAAWITRVSINVCYDEFRRRQRKAEGLTASLSDDEADHLAMMIDGRTVSAEDMAVRSQLAEKILASLSPKDRVALTMVYSEDYSLDETANALGITTSSLKSRLFRCRGQLKARFGYLFK